MKRTPRKVHAWLARRLPEPLVLLLYAVLIGIVGGYGAVGFRKLIDLFIWVFSLGQHALHPLGVVAIALAPVVGLLVVSIIVKTFAPEAKGHGVPEVMAAIAENGSVIRPRVVLIKAIASALCIGSGGSVGREGPIVQIGSAFGSALGQYMGLPEQSLRLLLACGAGAGIAATFNAPIGGVLFATEVILGSFALQNFTAIVIASVVSASIGRIYLGNHPSFPVLNYQLGAPDVFWIYVVLGVLAGLWSVFYIKALYGIEDWFDARKWPFWTKAILGGAIVGIIGIWFPQIFGVGYPTVDAALANHIALWLLVSLLFLKLLATSVTIAAGGSGGVFSPGLYMGSMLGGAMGLIMMALFPHSGIDPRALAAIAMAGVFAGSAQAPVTSIIMLFEMTGDYAIILPLMITSVLSATIASMLSRETIYTMKLLRRGLDVVRKRDPDRMRAVTVGEALKDPGLTFADKVTVEDAWAQFAKTNEWFALVRNERGVLLGSVARAKVLESLSLGQGDALVRTLLPQSMHRIDVTAPLSDALGRMNKLGVTYLLVCKATVPVGVIGSADIVRAYRGTE